MPASTLGFAAASITQSHAGNASTSLRARKSPCTYLNTAPEEFRAIPFRSGTQQIVEAVNFDVFDLFCQETALEDYRRSHRFR